MSKSTKKPKLADILGTKLTQFQVISGGMVDLDGEEVPKLTVKGIDESEESLFDKQIQFGFVSPSAIDSIEKNVEFDEDQNVLIMLPFPKKLGRSEMNWIKNPF